MTRSIEKVAPTAQLRRLASVFCRPVFTELAKGNLAESVVTAKQILFGKRQVSVATVLERAYAEIRGAYRNEYVYKNELTSKILFARHTPRTASLVTEMRAGASILDIAVFNGTSSAYEIKTQYDNFSRLNEQLTDYSKVFDKVFIVTHAEAASAALDAAPAHVGVLVLSPKGPLSVRRQALTNRERVDTASVFNTLRQSEYLSILSRTHGWKGDVPRGLMFSKAKSLFCELTPKVAHDEAVVEWRKRTTNPILAEFVTSLPPSLRALALSEPLSGISRQRLKVCITTTM